MQPHFQGQITSLRLSVLSLCQGGRCEYVATLDLWLCLEPANHSCCLQKNNSEINHIKEGNVLFNDIFNTFYLLLYGLGYMVKDIYGYMASDI